MRKPAIILAAALALGLVLFAGAFYCARYVCVQRMVNPADDLNWLKIEFRLGDADLARIRVLHDGYLPKCSDN